MQWVHLRPSILSSESTAPVLRGKKCSTVFNFWDRGLPPLPSKHVMHLSFQVLGATPQLFLQILSGKNDKNTFIKTLNFFIIIKKEKNYEIFVSLKTFEISL